MEGEEPPILGGEDGETHIHIDKKREAAVCLWPHNVSVHPLKHCKWEKYAWVSQVTGLRGHIIDPFGGKNDSALKRPRLWKWEFMKQAFVNSKESICQFYYISGPDGH